MSLSAVTTLIGIVHRDASKKRLLQTIALVCAATSLLGCAASPPKHESGDEKKFADIGRAQTLRAETAAYVLPKLPEPGKAIVYVIRPNKLGMLVRFNIYLDGQDAASEMGYTRPDQYIYFNVHPGEHKIYSDAENWSETIVRAEAGKIIFLEQRSEMSVIAPVTGLIGALSAKNFLTEVPDYEAKKHLPMLGLGTIIKTDK